MRKVELVFFEGCPNVERAKQEIHKSGIATFTEIRQNGLPKESPYLKYSSPTVLLNGKVISGGECGAYACSIMDWSSLTLRIQDCPQNQP